MLKDVSRSFYLSLRLLPEEMREGASVGYLLARTSDTIADVRGIPGGLKQEWLARFSELVVTEGPLSWPSGLLEQLEPSERVLFQRTGEVLKWLARLPQVEAELVREVVGIIIGGQQLDLERFSDVVAGNPVVLPDTEALDDYTWRVAGCVGAFWTKLGYATMGERFSKEEDSAMLEMGVRYGKGLQLVNILRDLPEDLAAGRCYLPVEDPKAQGALMESHALWLARAAGWVEDGERYARVLESRRLRMASVLPAMIAAETLERMRGASWEQLRGRIKVPRRRVYQLLLRSLFR